MTTKEKLKQELAKLLIEKERRQQYCKFDMYFPDTGEYRRELYPKHVEFMNKGSEFSQRAFIAANRTGKSLAGGYEMTCHLTGNYPNWWKGRKFTKAVNAWACGVNNIETKNVVQEVLLGSPMDIGSGLIPKENIVRVIKKPGVAEAVETVYVTHKNGGVSELTFKSYEQGRETFQGTKRQVIWLDEEPRDQGIFTECLTRTMDDKNPGIIYCTFTPLFGLSEVVLSFLKDGKFPHNGVNPEEPYKFVTQVSWEEVPHLNEQQKKEILSSYSDHEKEARSRGVPSLGAGAIYPFMEDRIKVEPFEIPSWWPKVYGMDTGWQKTAAVWAAIDVDSNVVYLYSEHYEGQAAPAVHASAIKARGPWIPGVIDPAADKDVNRTDGMSIFRVYEDEELRLEFADNSVNAGILKVYQMLESGQLKVFSTLRHWLAEYRVYRRDENGKIVKKNDHLLDATRYLIMTGLGLAEMQPDPDAVDDSPSRIAEGMDNVTGY